MRHQDKVTRFEAVVFPHLDAVYNLARWMTRHEQDAEDVAQEACIRAFQFFDSYRNGDSRAWLLRIVRNTCYTWLQQNRGHEIILPLDDQILDMPARTPGPELTLLRDVDAQLLHQAMDELPAEFREVLVLREMEELSYKEIAEIASIPLGTVMSRLARARKRLEQSLRRSEEASHEL